jgi:hypothetical protein
VLKTSERSAGTYANTANNYKGLRGITFSLESKKDILNTTMNIILLSFVIIAILSTVMLIVMNSNKPSGGCRP